MKYRVRHLACLGALASASLFSVPALAKPVRERTPIKVDSKGMGSIVFAQLLFKIEKTGEINGIKDSFVKLFNDALRDAGYNVPGSSTSVFSADDLPKSDFMLAGAIKDFDCSGEEGVTCGIAVDWELLDRRTNAVVYRVSVKHEEKQMADMSPNERARTLLIGTLHSLLSRPGFVQTLEGSKQSKVAARQAYEPRTIKACTQAAAAMPKGADKALDATVVLKVSDAVGSGVVISPDGFILTAAHVVTEDEVDVRLRNGTVTKAEVLRLDEDKDIALIRLKDPSVAKSCLQLDTTTAKIGDDIFALGSPAGETFSFSLSRGIVSGMRTVNEASFLQTDAPINPGNSGGPLVNASGKVAAIVSWKVKGEAMEGLGFGVPSSSALRALGLRIGDETDTIAPVVKRGVDTSSLVVDTPDPDYWYVGPNAPGKTPGWVPAVRVTGMVLATAGATVVLITGLSGTGTPEAYRSNVGLNTVGWIGAGVGVGMVVGSYVFKPKKLPPPETTGLPHAEQPKPQASASISPVSAEFKLSF